ncbi:hypothetical protein BUE80_DR001235 [Diplocarpon rosae]|nr:hypothetical protein BUE80_DR001235 [Diplocarpon rosae]
MAKKKPVQVAHHGMEVFLTSAMSSMTLGSDLSRPARRNIVNQFNRYFGEESKLANWVRLCRDVGIQEDLESITQCRLVINAHSPSLSQSSRKVPDVQQALKKVWVNIYDLIDAVNNKKTPPRLFKSQAALSRYTIKNNKIFPKKKAKEGGPVRALLAHIFG